MAQATSIGINSKLQRALNLADRGFRIFPVVPNGKKPAIKDWPNRATKDSAQIQAWFDPSRSTQDFNIGIATGGGILALDVDVKGGAGGVESFEALDVIHDFPRTLTTRTASGGRHHIFRVENDVRNSASQLAPGIDIRGVGGFIVAPGSIIDGKKYEIIDDAPIAAAPVSFKISLETPKQKTALPAINPATALDSPEAISRATDYLQRAEPAIEGAGGDTHTYKTLCAIKDFGISESTALDLLLDHWNDRCAPPWQPDDLETKVRNAYAYGSSPPGIASAAADFEAVGVELQDNRKLFFETAEDIEVEIGADPLVDGYLDQKGFSVLYGESHVGKSFVALDIAFHVASGKKWAGRDVKQGAVVYVAAEGGRGFRKRVVAIKRHHNSTKFPLALVPCSVRLFGPRSDANELTTLVDNASLKFEQPVSLVVIDTLSRATAGANENASEDMTSFVSAVDKIRAATGAHVMVVHHSGKDTSKGARGHSSLRAATDTELEIAKRRLNVKKQRDGEHAPEIAFDLVTVNVGTDRHGKPVTSCAVEWQSAGAELEQAHLTRREHQVADALKNLVRGLGGGVDTDDWRKEFISCHPEANDDANKQAFREARKRFLHLNLIKIEGNLNYLVSSS